MDLNSGTETQHPDSAQPMDAWIPKVSDYELIVFLRLVAAILYLCLLRSLMLRMPICNIYAGLISAPRDFVLFLQNCRPSFVQLSQNRKRKSSRELRQCCSDSNRSRCMQLRERLALIACNAGIPVNFTDHVQKLFSLKRASPPCSSFNFMSIL